ncbi:MAG: 1,5-anhydro-D-fructose reductase [Planctomycetes bacterium ADurb.Bin126]|nr:MAG: 1,5-anhydro-D-fructose reductase [Planctomycetes bacterium ADurb.Bin126]HOD81520.1 Gfo/Idh/MocA family oxidoreductase [Phycisphaerae bacterium]HQL73996.1 Gfo/Idh/MocA family oxidoreductase [Phycisphaerae bacterium]
MNKKTKTERSKFTRRQLLARTAGAAAAFTIVPRFVLGGPKFVAPSEKVYIAIIGCGGQGRTNSRSLFGQDDAQIVAIADPMDQHDYSKWYYGGVAGRLPVKDEIVKHYSKNDPQYKCNDYVDFRDLFEKEKNIDAILCATPDHWHALVTLAAIKRGKHVYCEKPLTHNIAEARAVAKAAAEAGVATQMGNHGRSDEGNRITCEMVWDGAIGEVKEVHAWSSAGGWASGRGRPQGTPDVPKGFDWDLWLGPRAVRPYNPAYAPYNWRGWWDFGTGCVGDMAVHNLDPAFASLKLGHPTSVEAVKTDFVDSDVIGGSNHFVWQFPAENGRGPVTVHWYDGSLQPPRPAELEEGRRMGEGSNGVLIIGAKGTIMGGGWSKSPRIIPEAKQKAYGRPPKSLPRSPGHHRDWLNACKGKGKACSDFSYGARLTEFVLLGDVAVRSAGKKILWDGPNMKVTNDSAAQRIVEETYRDGFKLGSI